MFESINHWAKDCPDKTKSPNEAILCKPDFDHPSELKSLLSESWNAAVLDGGASKTVSCRVWLDSYIESLSEGQTVNTVFQTSPNIYHFKDRKTFKAI